MFTVSKDARRAIRVWRQAVEWVRPPRWMSFVTEIRCPRCGTFVPPRQFPKYAMACRPCLRRMAKRPGSVYRQLRDGVR